MQRNARANELRRNSTDAERLLWSKLRNRQLNGFKFRRQVPIGPYIADFVCWELKLIIEVDGGQHAEQAERDLARSRYLETKGFKIVRFWNNEVLGNIEGVLETLTLALSQRERELQ